ncbi:hypothetical protein KUCAC02_001910 [Chaenocephalus aceratus]|uniref:Uncharacterized protein n=1 Tax=Chaenocephalus aceratus TaxID=36190 RepID=A0ACB9XU33_CHAAC|nr:hypothetical protein KUCAC02_001910 [Chaenocephalus aceratus]
MKCLEAALGARLAGATGVGATSKAPTEAHPIVRPRREEGDGATRVSSLRQRGRGSVSEWREGPPAEMAASSKPHYPQRPFLHMHV